MPTEDLFLPLDEAVELELIMPAEDMFLPAEAAELELIMPTADLFLPAEAAELEPIMLTDDMFLPADATEFEAIWDENWDGSGTAQFMEEGEMGNETDFFKIYEETQTDYSKSSELQQNVNERQSSSLLTPIEEQNQPYEATELQEEHMKRTKRAALLAQTAEQSQMPLEALQRRAKRATMTYVPERSAAEKEIDQYYAEIRQKNKEEANQAVLNTIEKQLNPPASQTSIFGEQLWILKEPSWIPKARKWLRGVRVKQGKPQNTLHMTSEPGLNVRGWLKTVYANEEELQDTRFKDTQPRVDPAMAAYRKQYAEIQSKISPAKTATQKIRWTPNLTIPPPDGADTFYAPAEIRTQEGFSSAPPRVSKEQLKKRKREQKKREREEKIMDEALDTEVVPKPKKGKKLNEFEEAMKVAGMVPEDPDAKEKTKGKGKGRGNGGKEQRPWEEKGKRGPSGMM